MSTSTQAALDSESAGRRSDTLTTAYPGAFTTVESFNTVLTDYYGAGTVSVDTFNTVDGGGSAKIALPSGTTLAGGMRDAYASAQDWSAQNFSLWVMADDWSAVHEVQLLLLSGGTYDDGVAFRLNIKQYIVAPIDNEWTQLVFNREQFTVVGAAVWTDIQKIIVRGIVTSGYPVNIWFDQLMVFDQASSGFVSIDFDDGWESIWDAANYMSTKGLVGALHVIPSALGTAGFLTQAQVDDLARRGWDISGHGGTNLATLYATSPATAEADIRSMREWLDSKAYKGADIYAYPEGVNNLAIKNIVGRYFSIGRDVLFISQPAAYVAPLNVHSHAPMETTTLADINTRVTDTLTKGTWHVIAFHKIVTAPTPGSVVEYSMANFQKVIDHIVNSGAVCLPKSLVIDRLANSAGDVTLTGTQTLTNKTLHGAALIDATNVVLGTTAGSKIGTATTQKIGFFNATPVAQQTATADLGVALANLGLRASGAKYPITTSGPVAIGSGGIRSQPTLWTAGGTLTAAASRTNLCDATSCALTYTLPAASASAGHLLFFKKTDSSGNAVTISRAGTDLIDGATSYCLATQYKYVKLVSDGMSNWYVEANN